MNYVIIINTFKREKALVERSLRAALNQNSAPDALVFVDQNETPLELSQDIVENSLFKTRRIITSCLSYARNTVMMEQEAEWIVLCDDDGYMAEDYSETFKSIIEENPEVEVIAGSIVREDNNEFYTARHALASDINKFRNTKLLMGSNFAIRRDTFKRIGKYDEDLGVGAKWGSAEETDLAWKAYFAKAPMKYAKELVVYHPRPYQGDFKSSFKKAYRYGLGKGAMVSKWLIKKKKLVVLYEVLEMTLVPILKMLKSLVLLRGKMALISLSSLAGRYVGFLTYPFKS